MAYGLSNGHMTDDLTWPWKVKLVTPIRLERNISKLLELETSNSVCSFVLEMPSGRTNNFSWNWACPRSRDPTIFGIRSNISPKLLELETSNLICSFVFGMPSRRTNNFPESGRGLGHVIATIFGSMVGYPSDSLASCSQHLQAIMPSLIITYTMHQFDYDSFSIVIPWHYGKSMPHFSRY